MLCMYIYTTRVGVIIGAFNDWVSAKLTMDECTTPVLPRDRGVLCTNTADSGEVGHSRITADGWTDMGLGRGALFTAVNEFMRERPHTSTPNSDADAIHHLSDQ